MAGTFKTSYSRVYMTPLDPNARNNTYDWGKWHAQGILFPIRPYFTTYDEIKVDTCWAEALDRLFGYGDVGENLLWLRDYPGTTPTCKFYYHSQAQIWKLVRV